MVVTLQISRNGDQDAVREVREAWSIVLQVARVGLLRDRRKNRIHPPSLLRVQHRHRAFCLSIARRVSSPDLVSSRFEKSRPIPRGGQGEQDRKRPWPAERGRWRDSFFFGGGRSLGGTAVSADGDGGSSRAKREARIPRAGGFGSGARCGVGLGGAGVHLATSRAPRAGDHALDGGASEGFRRGRGRRRAERERGGLHPPASREQVRALVRPGEEEGGGG
mmetsp:Transcript_9020/g.31032  ORF Transcript_9020/g.31032 Transcript_9020/m.31032 type:complete len:221 (+) Transcript_9020:880-1542(+)